MDLDIAEKHIYDVVKELIEWNSKLNNIIYLELVFKPFNDYSYVHISNGEKDSTYVPVYKVKGEPYISITSVYGALRRIVEGIAKSSINAMQNSIEKILAASHCELKDKALRHICAGDTQYLEIVNKIVYAIFDKDENIERHFVSEDVKTDIKIALSRALAEAKKEIFVSLDVIPGSLEPLLSFLCPICRLVGGPSIKSKIGILSVKPYISAIVTHTKTSVDRVSNTVHPGYLYSIELLALDKLEIVMVVKNVKPNSIEMKLLKASLDYLMNIGITIGGRKTIGLGKFKLDPEESKGIYIDLKSIDIESTKSSENAIRTLIKVLVAPETLAKKPLKDIIKILDST